MLKKADSNASHASSTWLDSVGHIRALLAALLTLHVIVALYFAKDMFMPIVLGILIALSLSPIARSGMRIGLPAPLISVVLISTLGGTILIGGYSVSDTIADWADDAPGLGQRVQERLSSITKSVEAVKSVTDDVEALTNQAPPGTPTVTIQQPSLLSAALRNLAGLGTTVAVAFVLALFILSSGTLFYEKLVSSFADFSSKKYALRSVYELQHKISRYLFTITLINAGLGLSVGTAAYLIGLPNAAIWGAAAFALNYLPFIGTIVGTTLIGAVSIVTFDDLGYAFLAPAIYLALGTLEGQIVTPSIVGRSLKINTVSVFLSVIFWGWLWGIAGTLLAVPILVVVKVVCDGVPSLDRIGRFLDAEPVEDRMEQMTPHSVRTSKTD